MDKKFQPLDYSRGWDDYWRDHPQGYSPQEQMINWSGQLNTMIDFFNEYFDVDLTEYATNVMEGWYFDGRLDEIINEALFDSKADKTTVNALISQLAEIAINVKSFGAIGDGIADDSEAIQSAIDYSLSLGQQNPNVYVPPGVYNIGDTTINIPTEANLLFYGAGRLETIISYTGEGSAFTFRGNTTIRDMYVLNNLETNNGVNGVAFDCQPGEEGKINARGSRFENVRMVGFNKGIILDGWSNIVERCIFRNPGSRAGSVAIDLCNQNNDNIITGNQISEFDIGIKVSEEYTETEGGVGIWLEYNDISLCTNQFYVAGQKDIHINNNYGEYTRNAFVKTAPEFESGLSVTNNMFTNYAEGATTKRPYGIVHEGGSISINNNSFGRYEVTGDKGLYRALFLLSDAYVGFNSLACQDPVKIRTTHPEKLVSANTIRENFSIDMSTITTQYDHHIVFNSVVDIEKISHQYSVRRIILTALTEITGSADIRVRRNNLIDNYPSTVYSTTPINLINIGDTMVIEGSAITGAGMLNDSDLVQYAVNLINSGVMTGTINVAIEFNDFAFTNNDRP